MVNFSENRKSIEGIQYLSAFETFRKKMAAKDPSWLSSIRSKAIQRFEQTGFPALTHEDWKYTDVRPLARIHFEPAFPFSSSEITEKALAPCKLGGKNGNYIVFVDGLFCDKLSRVETSNGVLMANLSSAIHTHAGLVRPHLARYASYETNPFTALNTAFIHDGAFIYLPKESVVDNPIQLIYVSSAGEKRRAAQIRNLIIAERSSRAVIIESYVSFSGEEYFVNHVTEIQLSEGAYIDHHQLEYESPLGYHLALTQVTQEQGSRFVSTSTTFGTKLSRNQMNVQMNGEGASADLSGLYICRDGAHVDFTTCVHHAKPLGTSRQLFKGIMNDHASAAFNGKVYVAEDAQKTDAQQTNKNLLLSEGATANTRPQLEIFADDVKCTHGAAVGQIDEEALFYLKTRGIGMKPARNILMHGFAHDVIDRIECESVRGEIDRLVRERFGD